MFYKGYVALSIGFLPLLLTAQNTTASIGGAVKTNTGEILGGATIRLIHEPTGTAYFSQSGKAGVFSMHNLHPGGPYTIEVSFLNYDKERKKDVYVSLGENIQVDFFLIPQLAVLKNITVSGTRRTNSFTGNGGTAINIGQEKMAILPTVGRNLYDYLRVVPQARLISGNEGAVSIAGQNNRYNAFYVDGAVNNDVFGLAASGTNGGQAAIAPLSIDAIDQFQLTISPYDASLGNFTGAGINAITRSGSNRRESSLYYFTGSRNLAGKTPTGPKEDAVRLSEFTRKTFGFRTQGAITQNRFFYFINIELQRDVSPQPFSFNQYSGNTKDLAIIQILANTLKGTYQYDPGTFLDNPETVNADRFVTRFDWNLDKRHSLSLSSRFTHGERKNTNASNPNTIHFSNDGFMLFTTTHSTSVELKSIAGKQSGNKLLITYTDVRDDREPLQKAFPRVRIHDGAGTVIFGTDNSSTINLLTQKNWTLFDKYTFTRGKHAWSIGVDMEYSKLFNAFIQNTFGNYSYFSLSDFLTNRSPSTYQLGFPLTDNNNSDHTDASAKFSIAKISLFMNDEIRQSRLVVNYGLRVDHYRFLTNPATDDYTNTVALPAFSQYWDVHGTQSGLRTKIPLSVSPRLGFIYNLAKQNLTLRGGLGTFTGRIPLAWPGGAYHNNGKFIGGYTANASQLSSINFRKDPYTQWTAAELGATVNKEPLNLTTAKFSMPKLFRASLALDKKFTNGWAATIEGIFSKNLQEIFYTNINLLPPDAQATGPDNRPIHSIVNNGKIPLHPDGSNPYDYAILLGNNKNKKGYAYDLACHITGHLRTKWRFEISYHAGHSTAVNDGTSSVNVSQWRSMETVNGRNFITRSTSDFSGGHRLFALVSRTFTYPCKIMATTVSLVYTGQSGSPVSYVYGANSMTRDDGVSGRYDLIYIPSVTDLQHMLFLPNTVDGIQYTPQQQKEALETYILNDAYLRSRRGAYAERNGSRTPFTHIVDLKIKHDIRIKTGTKQYRIQLTYDVFNVTNLLKRNWGRRYFQPNDNIPLVSFAGYAGAGSYIPQYRFDPNIDKWTVSSSTTPAYSARWNAQLGIRIIF